MRCSDRGRLTDRRCAAIAIALLPTGPAAAQSTAPSVQMASTTAGDYVREASQRFGIPEGWIYVVIRTESAGRVAATSPAGAMGLMQLMPATWAARRLADGLGGDPYNPRDNILAGTGYLRELYDRYGAVGFLAAYNAGPGRYEAYRDRGRPLPAETRNYVATLAPRLQLAAAPGAIAGAATTQPIRSSWTQSQLFAGRRDGEHNPPGPIVSNVAAASNVALSRAVSGLFVLISGGVSQ